MEALDKLVHTQLLDAFHFVIVITQQQNAYSTTENDQSTHANTNGIQPNARIEVLYVSKDDF